MHKRLSHVIELAHRSATAALGDPDSPLLLWRRREPSYFTPKDSALLRWALIKTQMETEPHWLNAVTGDSATAIAVAARQLQSHVITAAEIDLALSATLACAIDGDATSPILISSALRRRAKIDPECRRLSMLWQDARF